MTRQADRITDKERLDWLTKQSEFHFHKLYRGCWIGGGQFGPNKEYRTPRPAIDAAIRASRRGKR